MCNPEVGFAFKNGHRQAGRQSLKGAIADGQTLWIACYRIGRQHIRFISEGQPLARG